MKKQNIFDLLCDDLILEVNTKIENFKKCTQKLGDEINKAGIEWKDEKFQELTKTLIVRHLYLCDSSTTCLAHCKSYALTV